MLRVILEYSECSSQRLTSSIIAVLPLPMVHELLHRIRDGPRDPIRSPQKLIHQRRRLLQQFQFLVAMLLCFSNPLNEIILSTTINLILFFKPLIEK